MTKRHLIIGGPGFGKTSLVSKLKELGYNCEYDDKSRELIIKMFKENPEIDTSGVDFNREILNCRIDQFNSSSGICFFDRGIPDGIAYMNNPPSEFLETAKKYSYEKIVFVCPPWEEIFQTEKAKGRAENSFNDAVIVHNRICEVYNKLGYNLINLPKSSIKERVKFILEKITS
jgi:predicted ATPase